LLSFFFQAEDGIRDRNVTGVQTCALPIYSTAQRRKRQTAASVDAGELIGKLYNLLSLNVLCVRLVFCLFAEDAGVFEKWALYYRSEERRVGKECRSRWSAAADS